MTEHDKLEAGVNAAGHLEAVDGRLIVAQAETGVEEQGATGSESAPPPASDATVPPAETPAPITVALEAGNIARLPADASIDTPRVNGADIEFVQPDGSIIVIPNGAVQGLTLFVGNTQIPPQTVAALFDANDIQAAAGPGGAAGAGNGSSGGNFAVPIGNIGRALDFGDLLPPTALLRGVGLERPQYEGLIIDSPTVGANDALRLNDDDLSGNLGGLGDDLAGPLSGTLNHDYGLNGTGSLLLTGATFPAGLGFAAVVGNGGLELLITQNGKDVMRIALDDSTSGNYTVTQLGPVSHPVSGPSEDNVLFDITYRVTDQDGDTADGVLTVDVDDDIPVAGNTIPGSYDGKFYPADQLDDEGATANNPGLSGNAGGDGDAPGAPKLTYGFLTFSPGADGLRDIDFASLHNTTAGFKAIYLLGQGPETGQEAVTFKWDGATHTLTAIGVVSTKTVFSLVINNVSTGRFDLVMNSALVHTSSTGPDNGETDDLSFDLPFTVTDGDGDTTTANLTISVDDDSPTVTLAEKSSFSLVHDETRWWQTDADDVGVSGDWQTLRDILVTFQSVQNRGIDPHALNIPFIGRLPLGYAESNTAALTIASEGYGADGAAASGGRAFSLTLTDLAGNPATEGVNSGLETTEGKTIYLFLESGYVVGRYDGSDGDDEVGSNDPAAFAIRIGDDGKVGVLQYVSLRHLTNPDGDDEVDLSDMAGHLKATLTLTDGDGDKASASAEIEASIRFQDDGPSLDDVSLVRKFGLLIDETEDNQPGTDDVAGPLAVFNNIAEKGIDLDGAHPLGFATESRSPISFDASYGVDGPGATPVSYALSVANASSGLKLTDGSAINLVSETDGTNSWIVGRVSGGTFDGDAAFAIAINPTSGSVSLVQYLSLQHVAGDSDDVISLASGTLSATVTITDGDGDSVSRTLDVSGRISFRDDGPTLNSTATISAKVDEDGLHIPGNLSEGNEDGAPARPGEENGGGSNIFTSTAGALKSLVNFGVDGFGSFSVKTTAPTNTAFKSMGETVVIAGSGTTLYGYVEKGSVGSGYDDVADRLVFTLTVAADGTYTFKLNDQIDHPTLNGQTGDNGENLLGTKIDLSGYVQATDGDGDSITLGAGKFTVDVQDDIPVVTAKAAQTVTETITYTLEAGNELYRAVQGKDDYDLLLTGRIGNQVASVNTSSDIGVGTGQAIDQGTPPDTLRIDMVRNLTASGNVNSGNFSADAHYGVPKFTFTVPQVKPIPQAADVATLFIQIFAVPSAEDNQSGTVNFFDNATIGITSIVAAGATITPVYSGSTIIGYVVSGVTAGTAITVNGAADFGRLEVTNYAGVEFISDSAGGKTTLSGTDSFSIGGLSTGVQVLKPFEVIHDESPQVNNTSDPNTADDTSAGLPGDLSSRLAALGLTELGHARATGSVSTLFEASVGADGEGSRSYGFVAAGGTSLDGVDSGLKTTVGNEAIKLYVDPTNSSILWGVTGASFGAGTKVFAAYIDELGQVWLVQFKAIAHNIDGATSAAYDDAISVLADIRVVLSLTDADGDTVSAWSNTPLKLTFQDDGPKAYDNSDAVTEGNGNFADGNVLTDATVDVLGTDGGAVTGARTGAEGGNGALTAVNAAGVTISGTYGDLLIKADGSYVYTLKTPSIPTNVTSETFTYQVTDGDGDTDLAQLVIALNQDQRIPTLSGDTGMVYEDGLPAGSQAVTDREIDTNGKFTVNANGEAFTLTVGGVPFTSAQLQLPGSFPSADIDTGEGLLKLTGYNSTTGEVSYTYTLKAALTHSGLGAINDLTDTIAISVLDATGDSKNANIVISIVDDIPTVSISADIAVGAANDAADTVAEDGNNLTGAIALVEGADQDATLAITLETGATLSAPISFALDGAVHSETRTVTGAGNDVLGTLNVTVNADGTASWTFNPALDVIGTPSFTFKATITDKDGDFADDTHTITIADGAQPQVSAPIQLDLNEAALDTAGAEGSNPGLTTEVDDTPQLTFTAGSDALVAFAFNGIGNLVTDLDGIGGQDIFWVDGSQQIKGYLDAGHTKLAITLDLSAPSSIGVNATGDVTVTATLSDNLKHVLGNSDQVLSIGSVGVVATSSDNDTKTGIVNISVKDDVPTVTAAVTTPTISETALGTDPAGPFVQTAFGSLNIKFNADGPGSVVFERDINGGLVKPVGYSSGGVALDYLVRPSNGGTAEELVAFKLGDVTQTPVFVVTIFTQDDPQYAFGLYQPVDHNGQGVDSKTLSFSIVATDTDGDPVSQTLNIDITDAVSVANPDTDLLAADVFTAETGNVITANDTTSAPGGADTVGPEGAKIVGVAQGTTGTALDSAATVNAVINGLHGKLTIDADGNYSYLRNPGSQGGVDDIFTYTIKDADGDLSFTTLKITIGDSIPAVTFPQAGDDGTLVDEAGLPARGLESEGSDSDADSETTSGTITFTSPDGVSEVSLGGHVLSGTDQTFPDGLTARYEYDAVTGSGSIIYSYTLPDNTSGDNTDATFAVVIKDADGDPASAGNLVIAITDDAPKANDDNAGQGSENTAFTINAFANDVFGADDVDTADAAKVTFTQPSQGTVTYDTATGLFTYTPAANAGSTSTTDSFTYTITDGDNDPSTATVNITLVPDSTPTVTVTSDANGIVDEAGLPAGTGELSDATPGNDNSETTTGSFNITTGNDTLQKLEIGFGLTTVDVTGATAGSPIVVDGDDGKLTVSKDGSGNYIWSYTLNQNLTTHDTQGGNDTKPGDSFVVTVTDNENDASSATLDITVRDDAPIATDEALRSLDEGTTITGQFDFVGGADGATLTHINGGAPLTFNGDDWSNWIDLGNGEIRVKADGAYEFKADALTLSPVAQITGTFTVTDGDQDTDTKAFAFQILDANKPVAGSASAAVDDDGLTGANTAASATDINADATPDTIVGEATFGGTLGGQVGPDGAGANGFAWAASLGTMTGVAVGQETVKYTISGGTLTATIESGARANLVLFTATITDAATGTYEVALARNVLHAAGPDGEGTTDPTLSLAYVITDADGSSETNNSLTVTFDDDAPTAVNDTWVPVITGAQVLTGLLGNDAFGADGVATTVAGQITTTNGAHGTVTYNNDGTFTYTPTGVYDGTDQFTYTIKDADGDTSTATVSVTVKTNTIPTVTGTASLTVYEAALDTTKDTADLSAGVKTGTTPGSTAETAVDANTLVFHATGEAITSIVFADPSASVPTITNMVSGTPTWALSDGGRTLTLSLGGQPALVLALLGSTSAAAGTDATLSVKATLVNNFIHQLPSSVLNVILSNVTVVATDASNDKVYGAVTVNVVDDAPVAFTPDVIIAEDVAHNTAISGNLNLASAVGADGIKSLAFDVTDGAAVTDVNGTAIFYQGAQVYYEFNPATPLVVEGRTLAGTLAFTATLNSANDTWSFKAAGTLYSGNPLNIVGAIATGGNSAVNAFNLAGVQDLLVTTNAGNTLNTAQGKFGVNQGQDVDPNETLRFDFVTNAWTDGTAMTFGAHYGVSEFRFGIEGAKNSPSLTVRAFDADNDTIFSGDADDVAVQGFTIVFTNASGAAPVVTYNGGVATITGIDDGDTFRVIAGSALYDRIEVTGQTGSFKVNGIGWTTTNEASPFDVAIPIKATDGDGDAVNSVVHANLLPDAGTVDYTGTNSALNLLLTTAQPNAIGSDVGDNINAGALSTDVNRVVGGGGGDNINTYGGDDFVYGGAGGDTIGGGDGADYLDGGSGNDVLTGGAGDDILIGGTGMDMLTGGAGADKFVFDNFDIADVIADYEAGDKVDLTALFTDLTPANVSEYVQYNNVTGALQVDADGAGTGSTFQTVTTVNITGGGHPTTITILFDDGTITPHQTDI